MNRLIVHLKKHGMSWLTLLCGYAAFISIWLTGKYEKGSTPYVVFAVLGMMFCVLTLVLLRRLLRRSMPRIRSGVVSAISRLFRPLISRISKRRLAKMHGSTVISGKSEYRFERISRRKAEKKREKRKKYSEMADERERLGYLYAAVITKKIRSGSDISEYDTPNEILGTADLEKTETELVTHYASTRYDPEGTADPELVSRAKEELKIR